ncbi:MAG: hypothetical protein WD425_11615 [Nitrospirales bacterium]
MLSNSDSDRVSYLLTLISAEIIGIYAKWTEKSTRSQDVTYTVHHSGVVNQQQLSGGWHHLGAFAMARWQNHSVEVYGALEGETPLTPCGLCPLGSVARYLVCSCR